MRSLTSLLFLLAACGGSDAPLDRGSAMVGPAGGAVTTPKGAAIDIPPGALASDMEIVITETEEALPSGPWTTSSRLYLCTPEGISFAVPARLRLPAGDAPEGSTIFWSRTGVAGYSDLGAVRSGDYLEANISHFSTGFIGKTDACYVGTCLTCADGSRCAQECMGCVYEGGQWTGCACPTTAACTPCPVSLH